MKNKYILKLFIGFLKKNNVYDEFLYYLEKDKPFRLSRLNDLRNPIEYIEFMINNNPTMLINDAFDWSHATKITRAEWYRLHSSWCKYYNIHIKKELYD